jgi:curli production assembly/transport component CsgG
MRSTSILTACLVLAPLMAQAQSKRPTMAVLPVKASGENRGRVNHLGKLSLVGLRDAVEGLLIRTQKLTVVDRKRLDKILDEAGLTDLGLTEPETAVKTGGLLGADYFLEVRVVEWSLERSQRQIPISRRWQRQNLATCALSVRIVSARTGKVALNERVGATRRWKEESAQQLPRNPVSSETVQALKDLALARLRDKVMVAFPMKVVTVDASGTVFLSYGKGTGIRVGDRCSVLGQGAELKDPDTGEVLGRSDTEVARVEVVSVEAKFCRAKLVGGESVRIRKGARCKIIREDPADWPRAGGGR